VAVSSVSKTFACMCRVFSLKGWDSSEAREATRLTLQVKVAAETAGVIFEGLLHQNKFLSQSAHFLATVWDFSASGDLLWVSRSWSSRRSGGYGFPTLPCEVERLWCKINSR